MFHSLRFKMLFGHVVVALLLLSYAAYAAYHLGFLSRSVDMVLQENYRSIRAATRMIESLERMDSVLWSQMSEYPMTMPELESFFAEFLSVFALADSNVTIEGERPLVASVHNDFTVYRQLAMQYMSTDDRAARGRLFREAIQPRFLVLKQELYRLLDMNQQNMFQVEKLNRARAQQATTAGIVVSLIAVALSLIFGWLVGTLILQPIRLATHILQQGDVEILDAMDHTTGGAEIDQLLETLSQRFHQPESER